MKISNRIAAVTGSVVIAVTGISFLTAGTANAYTSYGIVEDSWSGPCHGQLYGEKTDSGAYEVIGMFPQGLGSYEPDCKGWVDQSWNGGATWNGLIGFQHYGDAYGGSNIGPMDDSNSVVRVCVQSDADNTARCSGWW